MTNIILSAPGTRNSGGTRNALAARVPKVQEMQAAQLLALLVLLLLAVSAAAAGNATVIDATSTPWYRYDGVGGLSGGGATSTFLMAYDEPFRSEIMDWMFKPGHAASLDILKVEIGCDDETTDGCESCHMRSPTEVNCSRGYEWDLMKAAVARNPAMTLYGLPWGFAGWLGFNTTNP